MFNLSSKPKPNSQQNEQIEMLWNEKSSSYVLEPPLEIGKMRRHWIDIALEYTLVALMGVLIGGALIISNL